MEAACLRHTEIPHTSRLFSDFQYHFDRVSRFYAHPPGDPAAYSAAAERAAVSGGSARGIGERSCARVTVTVPRSILLARPDTVAVVTGQQVGLFSGPAYSIYKALTAARLAEQLNAQGIPAVPIFWLATEDHDFAEVNHTYVFGPDHRPVALSVDWQERHRTPGGNYSEVDAPPLDLLRETLAAFPFGDEVAGMVAESYKAGATFGAAFQALLERLLAKRGLLFIDPLDQGVRQMAAPLLRRSAAATARICTTNFWNETASWKPPDITPRFTWRRKLRSCFCWKATGASRCGGRTATMLPKIAAIPAPN